MNMKKLGMALVAVLVLGAVMANTAFGAAETKDTRWTWNGSVLTGSKTLTAGLVTGTKGVLTTTVGETPLVLESTGLECVECKIENSGETATGTGKLKFTGTTVAKPAGCQVANSGVITTTTLTVDPDYMISPLTVSYPLFKPVSGTTFATVKLEAKTGQTCPISNSYIVKGTVFVKSQSETGVTVRKQIVNSSGSINSEAGGSLEFGSKPATLEGEAFFDAGEGNVFGTEKK